jgi:hypothetical protein
MESGNERCVFRTLIVEYLESGAPTIGRLIGIRDANGCQTALFWMQALSTGLIGIRGANPRILEDSYWLLRWKAFTIGPMSADQHKQIGIRRGATSFNMSTVYIKQNVNIEKSQELKGRSEKFKSR